MAATIGGYNHGIRGQKRTITGQYVYNTKRVHSVPAENHPNKVKVTQQDIDKMTLWGE